MGLSLSNLRTELRVALGVDAIDLPNAPIATSVGTDELLNRSLWEVAEKFPFREKEVSTNFTITNALGAKYALPGTFEALLDVAVQDLISLTYTPLNRMTKVVYDSLYTTDTTNTLAFTKPTDYVRDGDCIIFWPSPDVTYTIRMRFLLTIADLTDINSVLTIPQSWHEIILLGAIWRGFLGFGDYERADRCKQHQLSLITSAVPIESKEEFDTHLGGVEIIGRDQTSRTL